MLLLLAVLLRLLLVVIWRVVGVALLLCLVPVLLRVVNSKVVGGRCTAVADGSAAGGTGQYAPAAVLLLLFIVFSYSLELLPFLRSPIPCPEGAHFPVGQPIAPYLLREYGFYQRNVFCTRSHLKTHYCHLSQGLAQHYVQSRSIPSAHALA